MKVKPHISRSVFIYLVVIASLSIGLLGSLMIHGEYAGFSAETEALKREYLGHQKAFLKTQVEDTLGYIQYMEAQTEERLKASIRDRVDEAHAIAANIYNQNKTILDDEQIGKLIRDALRPIRFNSGRGYYFIVGLDGTEVLFADRPEMEGRDMLPVQGARGEYVVRDMIDIVRKDREGFYRYTWTKPGKTGRDFPKIAFVKLFEPFGWIIGTGEYLDDVERDIRQEVIERIEKIRFGEGGYIFVGQWDGPILVGPLKGRNILKGPDLDRAEDARRLIALARSGGGFAEYVVPRLSGARSAPKLSYVAPVRQWKWIVGAGVYLDELAAMVEKNRLEVQAKVKLRILQIAGIMLALLLLVYFFARRLALMTKTDIDRFKTFFTEAGAGSTLIDPGRTDFAEFEDLARSANRMIEERLKAQEALVKSEATLNSIFRVVPIGIGLAQQRVLYWVNDKLCEMTGYRAEELTGQSMRMLYPDQEEFDRVGEVGRAQVQEHGTGMIETRFLRKDGRIIDIELRPTGLLRNDYSTGVNFTAMDVTERRRIEEEQQKLIALVENSQEFIGLANLDGQVFYLNPSGRLLVGLEETEPLQDKTIFDFVDEDGLRVVREEAMPAVMSRGNWHARDWLRHFRTGERIPADIMVFMVKNPASGEPLCLAAVMRDITASREAEKALQDSERKYRELVENIDEVIFTVDPEGRVAYISPACRAVFGYGPEELVGRHFMEMMHPGDRERIMREFAGALGGQGYPSEYRMLDRSGRVRWVRSSSKAVISESGPAGLQGMLLDITEGKEAEKALQDSERKYRELVENIDEVIITVDSEGRIEYVSPTCLDLFGYPPEELVGRSFLDYIHSEDLSRIQQEFRLTLEGQGFPSEYRAIDKSGQARWVRTSSKVVVSEDGRLGIHAVLTDVTDRREMEEEKDRLRDQLQRSQKMEAIGTLAGGIAHDFNNILGAIIGNIELIQYGSDPDDPVQKNVDHSLKAAYRARDLIKQILTFSRQADHRLGPLDVRPIIKESLKFLRSSLPSTIDIQAKIEADRTSVLADATQVQQVLINLCTNAAHAMRHKGGNLLVGLRNLTIESGPEAEKIELPPGSYLVLSVEDTGLGMDRATIQRIFEPYFTTKEVGEGTGLGLAVVHGIVKSHQGTIRVYSEPGVGSVFNVYLPLLEDSVLAEAGLVKRPPPRGTERVLFVDDEELLVELGEKMLSMLGYRVTGLTSSEDALALFTAHPEDFDLIITDQTMPNVTGFDLAFQAISTRPDIPVILCTGYSQQVEVEAALSAGIKRFMLKPLIMSELAEEVRAVLDGRPPSGDES
ncbi:MAG: cache domain-containing protein [Proteobacteria bacterium]|nr:cache domain-containing protein [Pseudomonadota bacterium]